MKPRCLSLRTAQTFLLAAGALWGPAPAPASNAHLNYPDWWKPAYETEVIHAPSPAGAQQRKEIFEHRNDPENIRLLAETFFAQIDLKGVKPSADYVRLDAWGRGESRWNPPPPAPAAVGELLARGEYQQALDAYRDFFFQRLLNAPPLYPIQPEHPQKRVFIEFIHQPEELLKQNVARFTMLHAKGLGAVVKVDIGAPGQTNWSFVPGGFRPYDDLIFPPGVNFMIACTRQAYFFDNLLAAYMETGDKAYLKKWAAYLDDRSLNFAVDADAALTAPPSMGSASTVSAGSAPNTGTLSLFLRVFGHLDYVAQRRPELVKEIPSTTLARLILDMWKGGPVLLRATRASSNNRSIEMYSEPFFNAAMAFPEFKQARYYLRERVRTVELYPTVTMMADGSDIENEVGYNRGYVNSACKTRSILLSNPAVRPPQADAKWFDDLSANLGMRMRFLLFMRLNNGWDLYPSHYRVLNDFSGPNAIGITAAPHSMIDPAAKPVISKIFGDGSEGEPLFRSVAFPYAGKYLIRSGWEKDAQQLYMQSPRPYSTATWKNANDIQLFAFGQPLLTYHTEGYGYTRGGFKGDGVVSVWEDGFRQRMLAKYKNPQMKGLYQWEFTPVFVDECPQLGQETYAKLPESIRGDPAPAYGRGQAMAWQTPLKNRWHESGRFTFAEGEYSGPFAKMDGSKFIYDVAHRRQILFCREAGLWIIWDRLGEGAPHRYRLEWKFAQPFQADQGQWVPGFLPSQIHAEDGGRVLRTDNPDGANLTVAMQSASRLTPEGTGVAFDGSGTVLSFLYPRRTAGTDLSSITHMDAQPGQTGFRARTPEGYQVEARTAASAFLEPQTLRVGSLEARAESLVVVTSPSGTKYGIALGCRSAALGKTKLSGLPGNFEFVWSGEKLAQIQPIDVPLERPAIEPAADRFAESVTVSIHHPVKEAQLRYTLDGSDPTPASPLYRGPFTLQASTVVKARAFRPGVKELPPTPDGSLASAAMEASYVRREPLLPVKEPHGLKPGLAYAYYEGDASLEAETPAGAAPLEKGEVKELLETPRRSSSRGYLYIYTGFLNVPEDGVYSVHEPAEFVTPSVDAGYDLRLWLGGEEWYPTAGWHNYATWSVPLKKGLHPIRVAYVDWRKSGMPSAGVPWKGEHPVIKITGPGGELRSVPAAWLCH